MILHGGLNVYNGSYQLAFDDGTIHIDVTKEFVNCDEFAAVRREIVPIARACVEMFQAACSASATVLQGEFLRGSPKMMEQPISMV